MRRPTIDLTPADLDQISRLGQTPQQVIEQVEAFRAGFPHIELKRACLLGDGVLPLPDEAVPELAARFREHRLGGRAMKFVPASGAASRMFKPFFALYKKIRAGQEIPRHLAELMSDLDRFAFFGELKHKMRRRGMDLQSLLHRHRYRRVLEFLLGRKGLGYSRFPKGLILFHSGPGGSRTAFEEHLIESIGYIRDGDSVARLHFTVPPQFLGQVRSHFEKAKTRFAHLETRFEIGLSVQDTMTDTLAVDLDGRPFRHRGKLLFRPGGHGALLPNLNDVEGDIVFIKNVDNVVPDSAKPSLGLFKEALGGVLVVAQRRTHEVLRTLEREPISERLIQETTKFAEEELQIRFPPGFERWSLEERRPRLFNKLNRPLRVCGVVQNLGEPGGGPFWVSQADGSESLQIVEVHQIDHENHDQHMIWRSSEFFNPVDVVCAVRDYRGRPFNLMEYRDPNTAFVSHKTIGGRELRALELPGLWNGSMAHWTTLFVEVPVSTFNPVKTVEDLLRPGHQP